MKTTILVTFTFLVSLSLALPLAPSELYTREPIPRAAAEVLPRTTSPLTSSLSLSGGTPAAQKKRLYYKHLDAIAAGKCIQSPGSLGKLPLIGKLVPPIGKLLPQISKLLGAKGLGRPISKLSGATGQGLGQGGRRRDLLERGYDSLPGASHCLTAKELVALADRLGLPINS